MIVRVTAQDTGEIYYLTHWGIMGVLPPKPPGIEGSRILLTNGQLQRVRESLEQMIQELSNVELSRIDVEGSDLLSVLLESNNDTVTPDEHSGVPDNNTQSVVDPIVGSGKVSPLPQDIRERIFNQSHQP